MRRSLTATPLFKAGFVTEEHQEAGGDGDCDQAQVLHQLEFDGLLLHARAGH